MAQENVIEDQDLEYFKKLLAISKQYYSYLTSWEGMKSTHSFNIKIIHKKLRREQRHLRHKYKDNPKKAEFLCENGSRVCDLIDDMSEEQRYYDMAVLYIERDKPILEEVNRQIKSIQKTGNLKKELLTRVQLYSIKKELMARSQLHPYRIAECLEKGGEEELERYLKAFA